jgi:tetratricopeptide (TPR) repeat protein
MINLNLESIPKEIAIKICKKTLPRRTKICPPSLWEEGIKSLATLRLVSQIFKDSVDSLIVFSDLKNFSIQAQGENLNNQLKIALRRSFETSAPFYWVWSSIQWVSQQTSFSLSQRHFPKDIRAYLSNPWSYHASDESALGVAIINGRFQKVKLLLEHGAEVNPPENVMFVATRFHRESHFVATPLSLSIQEDQFKICELLVSKGAVINDGKSVQWNAFTPPKGLYSSLDYAALHEKGRVHFFECLIRNGGKFFRLHEGVFSGLIFCLIKDNPRYVAMIVCVSPFFLNKELFDANQMQNLKVLLSEKVELELQKYEPIQNLLENLDVRDFFFKHEELVLGLSQNFSIPSDFSIPILNNFYRTFSMSDLDKISQAIPLYHDQILQCAGLRNLDAIEDKIFALRRLRDHLTGLVSFRSSDLLSFKSYQLFKEERWDSALDCADLSLTQDPYNQEAHWIKTVSLLNLGRFYDAKNTCERALSYYPEQMRFLGMKARLCLEFGEIETALTLSEQVSSKGVSFFSIVSKIRCLIAVGRYVEAGVRLEQAAFLELNPQLLAALNVDLSIQMGNFENAEEKLDEVLEKKPNLIYPKIVRARLALLRGDFEKTFKILDFFKRSNLESLSTMNIEARAYLLMQNYEEAQALVDSIRTSYPHDSYVYLTQALILMASSKYLEAYEQIQIVLNRFPMHLEALTLMKDVLLKLNSLEEGLEIIDRILEHLPVDEMTWDDKVKILVDLKKYTEILTFIEKISRMFPRNIFFVEVWVGILFSFEKFEEVIQVIEKLDIAIRNQRDFVDAKSRALMALKRHKELFQFADNLYLIEELEEGYLVIERYTQVQPLKEKGWSLQAEILYNLKREGEALKAIDKALEIAPFCETTFFTRLKILYSLGRYQEVVNLSNDAGETIHIECMKLKINALFKLKRYQELFYLAQNLFNLGFARLSLHTLKRLTKKNDRDSGVWELKARVLYDLKKFLKAKESALKAYELSPQNLESVVTLGWACFELDELILSEEFADKGLTLDPENVSCLSLKAAIYEAQDLDDLALEYAKKVLSKDPENVGMLYVAGGVYLHSERFKKALEVANKILLIDPSDETGEAYKETASLGIKRLQEEQIKKRKNPEEVAPIFITYKKRKNEGA